MIRACFSARNAMFMGPRRIFSDFREELDAARAQGTPLTFENGCPAVLPLLGRSQGEILQLPR
jgi:hypothetical protein